MNNLLENKNMLENTFKSIAEISNLMIILMLFIKNG